ncbi:hypothetical protein BDN67DRAFT_1006232 [Paxillus ammoniavirescens]|nr:hypothetical protein BDN67DRAFT_1006232 [Paxillus ammoniavirescens]
MGLSEVRQAIKDAIAWELPNNIPYEAKTRLISQFTTLWTAPAERCLTTINEVLDDVIQGLIETYFGRFKVLQQLVSELIGADVEEYKSRTRCAMKETLELEDRPNYTQNTHYLLTLREKWLNKYRLGRRNPSQYQLPSEPGGFDCASPQMQTYEVSNALHYLAQAGYSGLTADDLNRLRPYNPDDFEDELIVMADVRAYFHVAYKRIIDHIPLKIEHSLHQALAGKLSVTLLQSLIVDTTAQGNFAERMKVLVSEDPAIALRRDHLQARRARLQDYRRKLMNFSA